MPNHHSYYKYIFFKEKLNIINFSKKKKMKVFYFFLCIYLASAELSIANYSDEDK